MAANRIAFLFPGQGSQTVGMGKGLADADPSVRSLFETADRVLGYSLTSICFSGPEADLQLTANAQPAILTVSVACARFLEARGIHPAAVAGHSLGEYSALVMAGALTFEDAVLAVHRRGRYMQEAVPVGAGAMAALIGVDIAVAAGICEEAVASAGGVASVANDNAPGQVVIAGHAATVERAIGIAKEKGAKRALKLPVSAPFHCALMKPAQDRLAADLTRLDFRDLRIPLVNNADAREIRRGEEARDSLIRQVTARVRWTESVRALAEMGIGSAVETGPGQVLAGLVKRIDPAMRVVSAGDPAGLEAAAAFAGAAADPA